MIENLKKRIIGIIIVTCFSIIVAPIIFTGSGQKDLKFSKIKNQDDIRFKYINEVKSLDNKKFSKKKELNIIVEEKIIKDIKNIKKNDNEKRNWVIRVGTFSEKNNALVLLNQLKKDKYQSYIIKLSKNSKTLYAVNVGPFFSVTNSKKDFLKLIKDSEYKNSYVVESNYKK